MQEAGDPRNPTERFEDQLDVQLTDFYRDIGLLEGAEDAQFDRGFVISRALPTLEA